jgi:hypothetical protein
MQLYRGPVYDCPAPLYTALKQVWNLKHTVNDPEKPWTFENEDAAPDLVPNPSPYE